MRAKNMCHVSPHDFYEAPFVVTTIRGKCDLVADVLKEVSIYGSVTEAGT